MDFKGYAAKDVKSGIRKTILRRVYGETGNHDRVLGISQSPKEVVAAAHYRTHGSIRGTDRVHGGIGHSPVHLCLILDVF